MNKQSGKLDIFRKIWKHKLGKVLVISVGVILVLFSIQVLFKVLLKPRWVKLPMAQYPVGEAWKGNSHMKECPITLVTFLMDIGRGSMGVESRSFGKYLKWFEGILDLNACMHVYVSEDVVDFVKKRRGPDLMNMKTKIHIISHDTILKYRHYSLIKKVIDEKTFVKTVKRPNRPEVLVPDYNAIMFLKMQFLLDATKTDDFHSKYFFWVDAGYGHGELLNKLPKKSEWPSLMRVENLFHGQSDKFFIVKVKDFDQTHCTEREEREVYRSHRNTVSGGFYGGSAKAVQAVAADFDAAVVRTLRSGIIDDDQTIIFSAWCANPSNFVFYDCPQNLFCSLSGIRPCWDSWACPAYSLQAGTVSMNPFPEAFEKWVQHNRGFVSQYMTHVLLTAVFFCVIFPIAFVLIQRWKSRNNQLLRL